MTAWAHQICEVLTAAGLLPVGAASEEDEQIAAGRDLLPYLTAAWNDFGEARGNKSQVQKQAKLLDWLAAQRQAGARLTLGVPLGNVDAVHRWIGLRLAWWPRGIPHGRRVGFLSSRRGRSWDAQHTWFTMLRAACSKIDHQRDVLITAPSTTTHRFVQRCGELFGLRVLNVDLPGRKSSLNGWLRAVQSIDADQASCDAQPAYLSPTLPDELNGENNETSLADVPLRDCVIAALCDRLFVLSLRRGGNTHKLMCRRLEDSVWPSASVFIALGRKHVSPSVAEEMLSAGAVGWVAQETLGGRNESTVDKPPTTKATTTRRVAPIISMPTAHDWQFLTHCTRRRDGPWPDQPGDEYLDELIVAPADADHSSLSALLRILTQQRILASSETIRGGVSVVSLTEVPLAELGRMRVFRPHRGRWDFEPYGICIHRDWLQARGARQVNYGDDQQWDELTADAQPFFQRCSTKRKTKTGPIDWTAEREWRHIGDIDLSRLESDEALVFVPSPAEAEQAAAVSRWPVVIVSDTA